jgi:hypothetical protein
MLAIFSRAFSKSNFVLLVGLMVLLFPFLTLSNSPPPLEQPIANINLSEAAVVGQSAKNFDVSFVLENQGSSQQFDIRYGVELVRQSTGGAQAAMDAFIAPEVLTLAPQEKKEKQIKYDTAGIASGEYQVWVTARTTGGVVLGLGRAGNVTIQNSDVVEIKADTCTVKVGNGGGTYSLKAGVDVGMEEDLVLTCAIKNHSFETMTVSPQYETFKRTIYGEQINLTYPAVEKINLKQLEERLVSFTLPKATIPQAYDVTMSLLDTENKVVSNHLTTHYVLQGESATIQTVSFDRDTYMSGEDINISLLWTGSADNFPDSRIGGSANNAITAKIQVSSQKGGVCSEEIAKALTLPNETVSFKATADCVAPIATVTLYDSENKVLDTRVIEKVVDEGVESGEIPEAPKTDDTLMLVTVIALAVALVVTILFNHRKKATYSIFIFLALAFGSFTSGVEKVEAVTFTTYATSVMCIGEVGEGEQVGSCYKVGDPSGVSFTVNANKSTYSPGEKINLSTIVNSLGCSNAGVNYTITMTLGGQTATVSGDVDGFGSATLVAPAAAGPYFININTTNTIGGSTFVGTASIGINVASAVTPPTVSFTASDYSITAGEAVNLNWAVSNAAICTASGGWAGGKAASGSNSEAVSPTVDTTYTIACTGPGGGPVIRSVTIDVEPAPEASCPAVWRQAISASCTVPGETFSSLPVPVAGATCATVGETRVYNMGSEGPGAQACAFGSYDVKEMYQCQKPVCSIGEFDLKVNGSDGPVTLNAGENANLQGSFPVSGPDFSKFSCSIKEAAPSTAVLTTSESGSVSANRQINNTITYELECTQLADIGFGNYLPMGPAEVKDSVVINVGDLPPTLTASASNCSINKGESTCQSSVSWEIANPVSPSIKQKDNQFSTAPIHPGYTRTINFGADNPENRMNFQDGVTLLGSRTPTAICESGTEWVSSNSRCEEVVPPPPPPAPPQLQVSLDKDIIRSGESARVTVNVVAPYPASCTLYGVNATPITFSHNGTAAAPSKNYVNTTRPLTATQVITLTCEPSPAITGVSTANKQTRVNVIAPIEEI